MENEGAQIIEGFDVYIWLKGKPAEEAKTEPRAIAPETSPKPHNLNAMESTPLRQGLGWVG